MELRPNPDQPDGAGYYIDDPFGNRIELIDADWAGRAAGAAGASVAATP